MLRKSGQPPFSIVPISAHTKPSAEISTEACPMVSFACRAISIS
ncbi:MAG: hypothetical protein ACLSAP_10085 [Oscillospiraceae bacterium]